MVPRYGWYLWVMELTASNTASCTIAANRAWAKGFCLFATAVLTAIAFQSKTTSALAAAQPNKALTVNTHKNPRVTALQYVFIFSPPSDGGGGERHDCDFGLECP